MSDQRGDALLGLAVAVVAVLRKERPDLLSDLQLRLYGGGAGLGREAPTLAPAIATLLKELPFTYGEGLGYMALAGLSADVVQNRAHERVARILELNFDMSHQEAMATVRQIGVKLGLQPLPFEEELSAPTAGGAATTLPVRSFPAPADGPTWGDKSDKGKLPGTSSSPALPPSPPATTAPGSGGGTALTPEEEELLREIIT